MPRSLSIALIGGIGFVIGALFGALCIRLADHMLIDWPATATTIRDLLTATGLLCAGAWTVYLVWRRSSLLARAEISHDYMIWSHRGKNAVRVIVHIRNSGEVRINPGIGYTEVQSVPTGALDPSIHAEDAWIDISRIEHPLQDHEVFLDPGENEQYSFDVEIPDGATVLQFYTAVECERRKRTGTHQRTNKMRDAAQTESLAAQENGEAAKSEDDYYRWDHTTLVDLSRPLSAPCSVQKELPAT